MTFVLASKIANASLSPARRLRSQKGKTCVAGQVRARQRRQFARLRRTTTFELLLRVRRVCREPQAAGGTADPDPASRRHVRLQSANEPELWRRYSHVGPTFFSVCDWSLFETPQPSKPCTPHRPCGVLAGHAGRFEQLQEHAGLAGAREPKVSRDRSRRTPASLQALQVCCTTKASPGLIRIARNKRACGMGRPSH